MPRYTTTFAISCMTRQAFEQLARRLMRAEEVRVLRILAAFTGGTMTLECDANDRATLDAWMKAEHLQPTDVVRQDIEAENGEIRLL